MNTLPLHEDLIYLTSFIVYLSEQCPKHKNICVCIIVYYIIIIITIIISLDFLPGSLWQTTLLIMGAYLMTWVL